MGIRGELAKLGVRVSATRIRTLLRANATVVSPGATFVYLAAWMLVALAGLAASR